VRADREGRILAPSDATDDTTENCRVQVFGRGVLSNPVPAGTPSVDINGRPGFAVAHQDQETNYVPHGVYWLYADGAWASVTCEGSRSTHALDIARRTTFEPEPFTSGLRLRGLPDGFAAESILESTVYGQPSSALILKATDPGAKPSGISIIITPDPTTVPPGTPGYEEDRIAGHPAVFNVQERWLALNVDDKSVRIDTADDEPGQQTAVQWPPGRRELLIRVAEDLKLARDLDDTRTRFDAQDVFPR
jgi:hypothetical protein